MAGILRMRKLELAAWMVFELDKAWDEADGEVCEAIDMLEWNGREMLRLALPAPLASLPTRRTGSSTRASGWASSSRRGTSPARSTPTW
jgi:acyl-CoA reductase-like NAD-dependent aldehyde dehydrogenase